MSILIQAIYKNGVLRPLTPLTLPEHIQVQLTLETAFDTNIISEAMCPKPTNFSHS